MSPFAHLWYRALLLLYPAEFRRRFGAEMLRVLADQALQARALSPAERWWGHCRATFDVVGVGVRERVHAMNTVIRAIGMVLIAAAALQVIYDLATPKLSMGIPAWAMTLIVCSFGVVLTTTPARHDRRSG